MINKPRSPEGSSSSLFRTALFIALASSGCTKSIPGKAIPQAPAVLVKQITQRPDISEGLNVDFFHHAYIDGQIVKDSQKNITEDIPVSTNQPLEIDFLKTDTRKTLTSNQTIDDKLEFNHTIKTRPIDQDLSHCESEKIEGIQYGDVLDRYNILHLTDLLQLHYPGRFKQTYDNKTEFNSVTGKHETINTTIGAGVTKFKTIVGPVNIERFPTGVKTSTSIIRCSNQEEITSNIRSKLAKGTNTSHRRSR